VNNGKGNKSALMKSGKIFRRALIASAHVLAAVMLLIAGGTFTHHDLTPHSHPVDPIAAASTATGHSHTGGQSGSVDDETEMLHCGANILLTECAPSPAAPMQGKGYWRQKSAVFLAVIPAHEPPPPRLIS
jgi:hypothetical protein